MVFWISASIPPLHLVVTDHIFRSNRPQPDPITQRKQQTPREPNNPTETATNRRPSFFEARHIARGSNSGIHIALVCPSWLAAVDLGEKPC